MGVARMKEDQNDLGDGDSRCFNGRWLLEIIDTPKPLNCLWPICPFLTAFLLVTKIQSLM